MFDNTPKVISIPVGKSRVAIVDSCDGDLIAHTWSPKLAGLREYAQREPLRCELPEGARHHRLRIDMHRLIVERMIGRYLKAGEVVDHIDGDGLNNCRSNLRVTTQFGNMRNSRKHSNNKSGYKGVHWHSRARKWRAMIRLRGGSRHLGYFDTPEEAHEAYCTAAREAFGEFARFD